MSKATHQATVNDKNTGYFTQVENIVILGEKMTLHERAVYMHYKALAWNGAYEWWKRTRNENPFAVDVIARIQDMSKGSVSKARKSLETKGFISLGKISRTKTGDSECRFFYEVTIKDIVKPNYEWSLGSPHEPKFVSLGSPHEPKDDLRVSQVNLNTVLGSPSGQSYKELIEEPKKEPDSAAFAAYPAQPIAESSPLENPTPTKQTVRRTKATNPPKPKAEPDPLLSNPNVIAYREVAAIWPNTIQRQAIADSITDSALWTSVVKDWSMRGWSKMNVAGMLDVYRKGGLTNGTARASPSGKTSQKTLIQSAYTPESAIDAADAFIAQHAGAK